MRTSGAVFAVVIALMLVVSASAVARPIVDPPGARTSNVVFAAPQSNPAAGEGAPTIIWILAGFGAAGILAFAGAGLLRVTHHGGHSPAGQH